MQKVPFASLPAAAPDSLIATESVDFEALKAEEKAMKARRQNELRGHPNLAQRVAPAVAKDATIDPSAYYMAYDSMDSASLGYIVQMAEVGKVENFQVVANCFPEQVNELPDLLPDTCADNVVCVGNPGAHDTWAEDHGEYTDAGEMVVPAMLSSKFPIETFIMKGRVRRFYADAPLKLDSFSDYPRVDFSSHGAVNDRSAQQEALAAALSTGARACKMAVSYVEGGNFMPGRRPDGEPFALVGKDSVAVTAGVLYKAGRKGHSFGDAVKQIAKDYGFKNDQVIPVEQPGEFHIDMAMCLAGPGQVLLNDAREVAKIQREWVEEHYQGKWIQWGKRRALEKIDERAERLAYYEGLAEADLKKAGLQVFRVAGCFPATRANAEMNFFNIRQGTNSKGERFVVALGGDERAERAFAQTMLGDIPAGYHRIHFLDRELTPITLDMSGGIKCRTKGRVA